MSSEVPPPVAVLNLLAGAWKAQAVHVAAHLGIADLVKETPKTAVELARATSTHPQSLHRLLRALAAEGVFAEDEGGRFRLTPMAACLLTDAPHSQRSLAMMTGEEHFRAWGDLLYSIRTGRPSFDHVYGKPIFDYLATQPRAAEIFDAAMTGVHGAETAAMLDAYDFAGIGTLIDIGGGNGSLLGAVLDRNPAMKGILFDVGHVVERAKPKLHARATAVAGNFFEKVPPGADAYLMRHIIHDWEDERSQLILRNCRKAMGPDARLLLIESVIPPGNAPFFGKWLDVNMLVIPGGQERTEAEYRALYQAAGFRLTRVVSTGAEISVIEGVPA